MESSHQETPAAFAAKAGMKEKQRLSHTPQQTLAKILRLVFSFPDPNALLGAGGVGGGGVVLL